MAKTDIFKPLTYQGTTYPSKECYIADGNGVIQKRTYFRGSDGQYYAIDNNGNAVPMHLNNPNGGDAITLQYADPYQGDGPVVTPSEETWNYLRDRNQELQGDRDFSHFDIEENGKRINLKSNVENHDLNVRRQALMRVAGYDVPDNGLWDDEQQAIWDKLTIKDKDYDTTLTGFGKAMMDKLTGNTTYRDNPLIQDAVQAYNPNIIDKAKSSVNRALNTTAGKAITGTWGPVVATSALPGIPAAYLDAGLTSYFGAKGLTNLVNGNENWETALDIAPLGRVGKSVYNTGKQLGKAAWYSPFAQYPRYYAGKIYYGNDVELPTLYRKIKAYPKTKDGKVLVTNPDSRFIFNNGKESPVITNMTTDVPVRAHSNGDWDMADTMVFPGKTLLGKHVISTRPSDTFTYGDNIAIDPSKVTFISGDKDAIAIAQEGGMKTITNDNLQKVIDDANRIEKLQDEGNIVLEKSDWDSYTDEMQKITRNAFKSPTVKDYKFMDWVFQPKYKSEVLPAMDLSKSSIEDLEVLPEFISSQLGNAKLRPYLLNPNEWRNVLYDPATPAEANFRNQRGIILKKDYYKKHPK